MTLIIDKYICSSNLMSRKTHSADYAKWVFRYRILFIADEFDIFILQIGNFQWCDRLQLNQVPQQI